MRKPMLAHDLMRTNPPCVNTRCSVSTIIRTMLDKSVSAVMVAADDGSLIGVVSEGDLIRRKGSAHQQKLNHWLGLLAKGAPLDLEFIYSLQLSTTTAAAVMTSPILTLDEQAGLAEVSEVLLKHRIKQVPITRDGKLVGLISQRDILRALVDQEDDAVQTDKEG